MSLKQPRGARGGAIPLGFLNPAGGVLLTSDGNTAANGSAVIGETVVRIAARAAGWFTVGPGATAVKTGTSAYIEAGMSEQVALQNGERLSWMSDSGSGVLSVVPYRVA